MGIVYVLIIDRAIEGEHSYNVELFHEYKDALARMSDIFDDERKEFQPFDTIEQGEDCVEIYEEGFYDQHHLSLYVGESVVK